MSAKQKWSVRSKRSRTLIVVTGVAEVVLLAATLVSVKRRPAAQVDGATPMWTVPAFVTGAGPIAFFSCGGSKRRGLLAEEA